MQFIQRVEGGWEKIDPEPTKLAIGVEGGFSPEDTPFEVKKDHFLVVIQPNGVPSSPIPLTHTALPEFVGVIAQGVIDHAGIRASVNEGDAWGGDDVKVVSKYAEDLVQLDNGKKISNDPSSWRCEMSGDTQNLWLNLSTGYIGGGRKNWDGSGGSGAALKHFEETGRQVPPPLNIRVFAYTLALCLCSKIYAKIRIKQMLAPRSMPAYCPLPLPHIRLFNILVVPTVREARHHYPCWR